MRDFPFFDTEYGVASLYLKEIPYKEEAYIRIRSVAEGSFGELLSECISFCRMCGAERIFAADHPLLEAYPLYTSIVEMRGMACCDEEKAKHLFPVTEETVSQWRQLCNEKLRPVAGSGTLTAREEKDILNGGAYFIHDAGTLLGIGWIRQGELKVIAGERPGVGEILWHTLLSAQEEPEIRLEVASGNERAIRLYERMGLVKTRELTRWYRVL